MNIAPRRCYPALVQKNGMFETFKRLSRFTRSESIIIATMTTRTEALERGLRIERVMELQVSGVQPHAVQVASAFTFPFRTMSNVAPLAPPARRLFTRCCNVFPVRRVEVFALLHHDALSPVCRRLARRACRFISYHASCPAHNVDDHSSG